MNNENEWSKRKSIRLTGFDYNNVGAYFITICTQNRRKILSYVTGKDVIDNPKIELNEHGEIVGTGVLDCPQIKLTKYGEIANKYINQLNDFYDYISVESYVIMPNHIHLLLLVKENPKTIDNGQSRTPVPTIVKRSNSVLSQFVSTFKRFCNKEYGCNIWQSRFNDHIIRNRQDYEEHLRYIYENPERWFFDELYAEQ